MKMSRNPKWTRDELILALDLYFLEEDIWNEFASDREKLSKTAQSIKVNYKQVPFSKPEPEITDYENDEFQEGKILTKLHKMRERNRTAVLKKKKSVLETTGVLACEVYSFDFFKFYGEIGFGFAECHHTIPLYELEPNAKTKLSDLGIVCANCHRMLHRARPWKSINELREVVSEERKSD